MKKAMHMYDEGKVAYALTIMLFCICVKVLMQGGKALKSRKYGVVCFCKNGIL